MKVEIAGETLDRITLDVLKTHKELIEESNELINASNINKQKIELRNQEIKKLGLYGMHIEIQEDFTKFLSEFKPLKVWQSIYQPIPLTEEWSASGWDQV